ncbi:MAG: hypothetical protein V8R49_02485 [Duodenibacillus massiliensis]
MLVGNKAHEKKTEGLWNLPAGTRNPVLGKPVMGLLRGLEDGSINFMWTQVVNIFQSTPNSNHWSKPRANPKTLWWSQTPIRPSLPRSPT